MELPGQLRSVADDREDVSVTRREYEDQTIVTVDFGAGVEAAVDVVGETAIVVAGDRQFEFEVPEGATDVYANDGMLVIEANGEDEADVDVR